ncbi:MAG TPA: hypothetical protein VGI66_04545 [Streptosporangiaceae bacterium]
MYQHLIEELAHQRTTELRAAARTHDIQQNAPLHALRVKTGWTLVHVGLKLAVPQPGRPHAAASRLLTGSGSG